MNATLPRMDLLNVALFQQIGVSEFTTTKLDNGNTQINDLKVFRSGTFKDSMGTQHTWEPEQMAQMVSNFAMLRDKGIFPNVPVRSGHRSFLGTTGQVIGYVTDLKAVGGTLSTTGESVTFLVASFEMTDPAALEKLMNGTFRARSAEVGLFETNDESFYWPVFQGFAFVDIPAVEGLYEKATNDQPYSVLSEENSVAGENNQTGQHSAPPAPPTPPQPPAAAPPAPSAAPSPAPSAAPSAAPEGQHGAPAPSTGPAPASFSFSLYGAPTTDFAAVQRHITSLEEFERGIKAAARAAFSQSLLDGKKIVAAQKESIDKLVNTLDDAAFEAYKETWNAAPAQSVVTPHAVRDSNPHDMAAGGDETNTPEYRISVLEETVERFGRAGMKKDAIEKTDAYIELMNLRRQVQAA